MRKRKAESGSRKAEKFPIYYLPTPIYLSGMLRRLRIKNLAVVEEVEWELGQGFNVLTGETGAGKSILIDAFLLLLGERADKSLVRTGAEGCVVEGELGGAKEFQSWLEEKGVEADADGTLVIKRQISSTGTGRQFLNGSAVTLGILKELGDRLVDLHGPHDHQTLLSPSAQRSALDGFGGFQKEAETVRAAWRKKKEAETKLGEFRQRMAGADGATQELIDHQVRELEQAQLQPGEDVALERDHAAAGHGKRIIELAAEVNSLLEGGEENALGFLGKTQKALTEWERLDGAAGEMRSKNEEVVEALRDLAREAERRAEQVGLDAERLAEMERRLDLVLGLKKKYGGSVEAALQRLQDLKKRQAELADAAGTEANLIREVEASGKALTQTCGKLSEGRKKAAPRFAKEVTEQLRGLGFAQSRLEAEIRPQEPGPDGADTVELLFAPNPGESPRPLRSIASSGEMARVMLALKTVLAERDEVPILIFDEVDANVGGETAVAVAERLRGLGRSHQVLCLTHLPAVAAAADGHFAVAKRVEKGRTFAELHRLEGQEREKELTRMLGGDGKAARMLAKELLENGNRKAESGKSPKR
ncbi:MAG: DNA repair protein RecN [Verrucomicrobia bacterium]|nr:DNA repair protein RecN [Verrucomicrobiota bacterium]